MMASNDNNTDSKNIIKHSASGNLSVVEELLRQGFVNVDAKTSQGRTALWTASFNGHSDVVELLLSHGADTEVRDDDEDTALQVACVKGHLNVVKYLIQAGANVNAKDINGSVTLICIYIVYQYTLI